MPENDITELQTLDIYQLTEDQYAELLESSEFDQNALYMTPASNAVTSVNGKTPSANGNVNVEAVYSVNNVAPDSSGNVDIVAIPSGGTTGQVLAKQSATDGDVGWENRASDIVMKYNAYTLPANSYSYPISATVDSGYSFLGWVGCTTQGWVSPMLIEFLDQANTTAWHINFEPVTVDRAFRAYYLEKKI